MSLAFKPELLKYCDQFVANIRRYFWSAVDFFLGWLIGQTWSNFMTPDYIPETIDALAYVGASIKRTPQVRYTHKFTPNTNLVGFKVEVISAAMN